MNPAGGLRRERLGEMRHNIALYSRAVLDLLDNPDYRQVRAGLFEGRFEGYPRRAEAKRGITACMEARSPRTETKARHGVFPFRRGPLSWGGRFMFEVWGLG